MNTSLMLWWYASAQNILHSICVSDKFESHSISFMYLTNHLVQFRNKNNFRSFKDNIYEMENMVFLLEMGSCLICWRQM